MILKRGDRAPDFELSLLAPASGEQVWKLSERLAQGPVFLTFVKESCPTCRFALPFVDRMFRNYPDSRVSMAVIAQDDVETARQMAQDLDLAIPVLVEDAPYPVGEQYGLSNVPGFFLVNQKGEIEQVVQAFAREELNEMNARIAGYQRTRVVPFYDPGEDVPFYRPG